MKGLHEMKKVYQAILRYLNMDLVTVIETFKSFVCEESGSQVTVPYQQNLDFILLRMQGLSKLLIRIVDCTRRSANYFLGLIKSGSFYTKGVVFLSTLASVWSLSREFCRNVVDHFNKLWVFREKLLTKPGLKWVDVEYELPEKLQMWLGEEYLRLITNETYDFRLLVKENDIKNYLELKDESIFESFMGDEADENDIVDEQNEEFYYTKDVKEELELEDFTPISRTAKQIPQKPVDHSRSLLSSKESIKSFIKNETLYRKVDPKKSLTISKINKKIWKEFKDDIKNKTILMQDETFVDYVKDYLDEYKV